MSDYGTDLMFSILTTPQIIENEWSEQTDNDDSNELCI